MKRKKNNKIINDPVYGFIKIENGVILKLIDHPYLQRLRRISQLGMSYLVYPGANHTRLQHVVGSMFLMSKAINQIQNKGHNISKYEKEALEIAMLLHDIGHGPFSHALESSIVTNLNHEDISLLFMQKLNKEFNGDLAISIEIFKDIYKKKFLHKLVSSQLDMDRLDYLKRDSFFSGVVEGNIGTERIINMLDIVDNELVIEEKGIYSIEKFLIARRLMYWQVYLHKTVIASENMLIKILKRAKSLISRKIDVPASPELAIFLKNNFTINDFKENDKLLDNFSYLDDFDIYACLKEWCKHSDTVLSSLSKMILNRNLLKIKIQNKPFTEDEINYYVQAHMKKTNMNELDTKYFVFSHKVSNKAYAFDKGKINILMKNGTIQDISMVSDQFNIEFLSKSVNKYFICYQD